MEPEECESEPRVRLVAAGADYPPGQPVEAASSDSFFKSAQWSADGTTIFTSSSENRIGTFVLPEDLLSPRDDTLSLSAQGTLVLPEPTAAIAPAPYFSLSHTQTHTVVVACTDHPIQLYQCQLSPRERGTSLRTPPVLASYPLIHGPTESHLPVLSLVWPRPGTHFLAGSKNLLALFDTSRPGASSEPLLRVPTIPSARHLSKGGGVGMRGTVAALAVQSTVGAGGSGGLAGGLVAAGTWTRWVGLYDLARGAGCTGTWCVGPAADAAFTTTATAVAETVGGDGGNGVGDTPETAADAVIGGKGIVQTAWSPCGRYLVVNERMSRGMLLYDVRVGGRLLGVLAGRDARTNQRLACDVFLPGAMDSSEGSHKVGGFEVWGGSVGGTVHVWEGVGLREGAVWPSWGWRGHESGVGSVAMHPSGSVVASCSGSWTLPWDEDDIFLEALGTGGLIGGRSLRATVEDSSLKIWSLAGSSEDEDEPSVSL